MGVQILRPTYRATLVIFLVAISLTLTALLWPYWAVDADQMVEVGFTRRCMPESTIKEQVCTPFPLEGSDTGNNPLHSQPQQPIPVSPNTDDPMKAAWMTAGFITWLTLFLQLATVVSYSSTIIGDRYFEEVGWRLISYFAGSAALMQASSLTVVWAMVRSTAGKKFFSTGLANTDRSGLSTGGTFYFHVGLSWHLALSSFVLVTGGVLALVIVGVLNPPEREYYLGDYIRIKDEEENDNNDDSSEYTDTTTATGGSRVRRKSSHWSFMDNTAKTRRTFYDYYSNCAAMDENADVESLEGIPVGNSVGGLTSAGTSMKMKTKEDAAMSVGQALVSTEVDPLNISAARNYQYQSIESKDDAAVAATVVPSTTTAATAAATSGSLKAAAAAAIVCEGRPEPVVHGLSTGLLQLPQVEATVIGSTSTAGYGNGYYDGGFGNEGSVSGGLHPKTASETTMSTLCEEMGGVGPSSTSLHQQQQSNKKKKKRRRRHEEDDSRDFYLYMQRCQIEDKL
ncbi:uncharacterized protein SAPINGB_P001947 [Magnusiomyces paraingens]|uniref:Transmembrane protein n=1 Tax=Magnusiomyces paraingens TaxID=2606893 RepID=A0A5E8BDL0_9ASCO|nr:uncharacterized protein SAPINGB_P001947 [Saprochaete ingens]VVT48779.1 unnamed protein product [Saprochaete ingens]